MEVVVRLLRLLTSGFVLLVIVSAVVFRFGAGGPIVLNVWNLYRYIMKVKLIGLELQVLIVIDLNVKMTYTVFCMTVPIFQFNS